MESQDPDSFALDFLKRYSLGVVQSLRSVFKSF